MNIFLINENFDPDFTSKLKTDLSINKTNKINYTNDLISNSSTSELSSNLSVQINKSDVCIAFLPASDPFSFYEIGLATALDIPIIIVSKDNLPLPDFLYTLPYFGLSGDEDWDIHELSILILKSSTTFMKKEKIEFTSALESLQAVIENPNYSNTISSTEFEQIVKRYFIELGVEPKRNRREFDFGFDFYFQLKPNKVNIIVEVKKAKLQSLISIDEVDQFITSVTCKKANKGLFITNSDFSPAAKAFCKDKPVALFSLEELIDQGENILKTL